MLKYSTGYRNCDKLSLYGRHGLESVCGYILFMCVYNYIHVYTFYHFSIHTKICIYLCIFCVCKNAILVI